MASVLVFLDTAFVGAHYTDDTSVRQDITDGRVLKSAVPALGNLCGVFELWDMVAESVKMLQDKTGILSHCAPLSSGCTE
jgi:hypothetical protein